MASSYLALAASSFFFRRAWWNDQLPVCMTTNVYRVQTKPISELSFNSGYDKSAQESFSLTSPPFTPPPKKKSPNYTSTDL